MIWDRERYIAHCNFEYTGREMFCELFGPLIGLDREWRSQGATQDEIDLVEFDFDYVKKAWIASNQGAVSGIVPKVIEDTAEYALSTDHLGRTVKLCKNSATIPLPLTYPVKDMDDWLRIKHWYEFSEDRIDREALKAQKQLQDDGYLLITGMPGGFDEPRELMGEEELCVACYEQPELVTDMLNTMADTCLKVFERVNDIVKIDCLCVHEDMAGKSGPLFGPSQVEAFMKPYYRRVWDYVLQTGCTLFSQDSDGDMNPIVEMLLDCGINMLHPCEPGSGMDIVQMRRKYGCRLALKGGIDKYVLRMGKGDILTELEKKICADTLGGGVVFGIDHRIPNGVPLENYRYYVNTAREMLGIEPIAGKGHERMAF